MKRSWCIIAVLASVGCQGLADPQGIDGPNHSASEMIAPLYEPGPSLRNPIVWEPDDHDDNPGGGGSSGTDSCEHNAEGCKIALGVLNGLKVKAALKEVKD